MLCQNFGQRITVRFEGHCHMNQTTANTADSSAPLRLIAHRGYSGQYPENTLLAYTAARDAGAKYFELDIQLSADGVPFLHHDKSLLRMAGVDKDFRDVKAKKIKSLFASYPKRFKDKFADNRFTTFSRYCKWLKKDSSLITFVEIKQESIDRWGIPTVVEAVIKRINRHKVAKQCVIISFNPEVIEYTRKVSKMRCGWVIPGWDEQQRKIAQALKPEYLFLWVNYLPANNADLWVGSWQWALYNLDDEQSARTMLNRGFYNLETNEIGTLINALASESIE